MNSKDPKLTALQFNEYINNRDINGMLSLMADDFKFIDKLGKVGKGKDLMIKNWESFWGDFPDYGKIITTVKSKDNIVILIGYALWSKDSKEEDHSIWTTIIVDDHVAHWQIFEDTEDVRKKLNIIEK
ncbi:hypothetical protein LCGC14_1197680 [marine sediment metagenome]|uniref:SnoaL-like domain-containing protein n=1 Tax=marine sediment metagenome TaxID=412755 RepID=A0A0F9P093_9ZZZZ|nr:nuclear transport factor 2 family protein [archaeon]HEC39404.1 nuclear transport factor 2 family protein [bacterium]